MFVTSWYGVTAVAKFKGQTFSTPTVVNFKVYSGELKQMSLTRVRCNSCNRHWPKLAIEQLIGCQRKHELTIAFNVKIQQFILLTWVQKHAHVTMLRAISALHKTRNTRTTNMFHAQERTQKGLGTRGKNIRWRSWDQSLFSEVRVARVAIRVDRIRVRCCFLLFRFVCSEETVV